MQDRADTEENTRYQIRYLGKGGAWHLSVNIMTKGIAAITYANTQWEVVPGSGIPSNWISPGIEWDRFRK